MLSGVAKSGGGVVCAVSVGFGDTTETKYRYTSGNYNEVKLDQYIEYRGGSLVCDQCSPDELPTTEIDSEMAGFVDFCTETHGTFGQDGATIRGALIFPTQVCCFLRRKTYSSFLEETRNVSNRLVLLMAYFVPRYLRCCQY